MIVSNSSAPSRGGSQGKGPPSARVVSVFTNLALLALIFFLGTTPSGPNIDALPGRDKLGHALAFGVFTGSAFWGFAAFAWGSSRYRPWLAALASTAVGGLLELVQLSLPYRSADFWDLLADGLGALGMAAFLRWVGHRFGQARRFDSDPE